VKETVIILGAGLMQAPALRIARELGLETAAVDGNPAAPFAGLADRFEAIDLKDKEGIAALGRRLQAEPGRRLAGVFTCGTDFSASVAWAARELGLPGHSYEAALDASDKSRMRACFAAAGVPSPRFWLAPDSRLPTPNSRLPPLSSQTSPPAPRPGCPPAACSRRRGHEVSLPGGLPCSL